MQTAVNRNGCIPLFTWRRLLSGRKVGPNFIVDAAVPLGDPCFLEVAVAASMESRLILGSCSRNLFFQIEMCCRRREASPVTTCGPGLAEQTHGRQNRASGVGRIQRSLLKAFLEP